MRALLQVFLAAFVPDGSRSLLEELDDDASAIFDLEWIGLDPCSDHTAARRFLFHDCSVEVAEWAVSTSRAFVPASVYAERIPLAAAIPAMCVVPDGDRTLRTEWMIAAANNASALSRRSCRAVIARTSRDRDTWREFSPPGRRHVAPRQLRTRIDGRSGGDEDSLRRTRGDIAEVSVGHGPRGPVDDERGNHPGIALPPHDM